MLTVQRPFATSSPDDALAGQSVLESSPVNGMILIREESFHGRTRTCSRIRGRGGLASSSRRNARALGFTLAGFEDDPDIHVMMNMYWDPLDMDVPIIPGREWTRAVDTSLPSPSDGF